MTDKTDSKTPEPMIKESPLPALPCQYCGVYVGNREGWHERCRITDLELRLRAAESRLAGERERVIEECAKVCDQMGPNEFAWAAATIRTLAAEKP